MTEQSVVAVYRTLAQAEQALRALAQASIPGEEISLVAKDLSPEKPNESGLGLTRQQVKQGVGVALSAALVSFPGVLAASIARATLDGVGGAIVGPVVGDVVKALQKEGIKCERRQGISPGVADAVTFEDPKGTPVDLYAGYQFAKQDGIPGIFNILKLGHVAYRVLDVQEVVKFYRDVLGFRVSDWRGDFFVFMRCITDHHSLNFIIDDQPQLHHIAFEVVDWSEIHKAVDYLAHNKIHLVWGPGRHVIGHNVATYHRNADLVRVEIFTEMDQMKDEALGYFDPRPWHQEFPLYPKMHGPETLRNYWGYGSERVIRGYQTNEIPSYEPIRS